MRKLNVIHKFYCVLWNLVHIFLKTEVADDGPVKSKETANMTLSSQQNYVVNCDTSILPSVSMGVSGSQEVI